MCGTAALQASQDMCEASSAQYCSDFWDDAGAHFTWACTSHTELVGYSRTNYVYIIFDMDVGEIVFVITNSSLDEGNFELDKVNHVCTIPSQDKPRPRLVQREE